MDMNQLRSGLSQYAGMPSTPVAPQTMLPGLGAAYAAAGRLGFGSALPQQQAMQAAINTAGRAGFGGAMPTQPVAVADPPSQRMAGNAPPGPMQQIGGTPQLSPQAMAMIDMMRQRAMMAQAQRMAQDRGVFSGQQQAAAMPQMGYPSLPQLYAGGR